MQQYLITAWDGTDDAALERRMAARPSHFEGAHILKDTGHFIAGGAMLDENGKMIGSTMIVQFETKAGLEEWMRIEPYITGKVWEKITVHPFRLAQV